MEHRSGGKYAGSHTSVIELGAWICDFAYKLPEVYRLSLGYISMSSSGGGIRKIKIVDETGGVLLVVNQPGSAQEIRIYTNNRQTTKEAIARFIADNNITFQFGTTADYLNSI